MQRMRAVDLVDNIAELFTSIANSPKSFKTAFEEIKHNEQTFKNTEDFAIEELESARKAAGGAGAGLAAGAAVTGGRRFFILNDGR